MTAPALYDVRISHVRYQRARRAFNHRSYLWLIDIDRPPRLPRWLRPFARFPTGVRAELESWLADRGVELDGGPVLMLGHAQVLGSVFNPLTVYWCHRPDGTLAGVVAEVNNTYGESHRYLLHPDEQGRAAVAKEFYVSPFLTMAGHYEMALPVPGERLGVSITLHQAGRPALAASVRGRRTDATPAALVVLLLRRAMAPYFTRAWIQRHGVALWLRRFPISPRSRRARVGGEAR
ncbi:MAG TPA: DUF1365 domain-containing protein [Pseudonocardia sp.]|nr:DUF1365 domain-containing protein [Pseudonocardia sp.]